VTFSTCRPARLAGRSFFDMMLRRLMTSGSMCAFSRLALRSFTLSAVSSAQEVLQLEIAWKKAASIRALVTLAGAPLSIVSLTHTILLSKSI
jgi:hypothetical protein